MLQLLSILVISYLKRKYEKWQVVLQQSCCRDLRHRHASALKQQYRKSYFSTLDECFALARMHTWQHGLCQATIIQYKEVFFRHFKFSKVHFKIFRFLNFRIFSNNFEHFKSITSHFILLSSKKKNIIFINKNFLRKSVIL